MKNRTGRTCPINPCYNQNGMFLKQKSSLRISLATLKRTFLPKTNHKQNTTKHWVYFTRFNYTIA